MNNIDLKNIGIIGNCSYIAHIDSSTNVVWMCMPRFDSPPVFSGLINDQGGNFSVIPAQSGWTSKQEYIRNTNILQTEVTSSEGSYRVTDFAPRFLNFDRLFRPMMLIRKIERVDGRPAIIACCEPIIGYGHIKTQTAQGSHHIQFLNMGNHVRLTTNIALNYLQDKKPFVLSGTMYMVFTWGSPLEAPLEETAETFLEKTVNYWTRWIKSTRLPDIFQKEAIRSALALKLHQYEDTGAIIASASTSLPESPGSGRNWDYRYCWLRDSYYTLNAFSQLGHFEELEAYFLFIENIIRNEKSLVKPAYTVTGDSVPLEKILENISGFNGEKPVRIGNDAGEQVQNDVYGQVLLALLPLYIDRRLDHGNHIESVSMIEWLLEKMSACFEQPDAGLWEFRGMRQKHLYTYLFHWAGASAAARIARHIQLKNLQSKAEALAARASKYIESCWNSSLMAFTQSAGTENLDASSLQLVTMNYLSHTAERTLSHVQAHQTALADAEGRMKRYKHEDDFGKSDSYFTICSFWHAETLACLGRCSEAVKIIENILRCSGPLGLLSEDISSANQLAGNYPQTYSHVGLLNALFRISNKTDKPIFI